MKINLKKVLPTELSSYVAYRIVRIATALYLMVMIGRSSIHLFSSDGGANGIAGIDISVEGGDNIVAIFHQWGATQLILALFISLLFFRYPGMTPLIVLTLAVEPVLRLVAGQMKSVTADGAPPGESLNGPSFIFLVVLFIASVLEKRIQKI
ncbi:MAG: hypothetical protein RL031_1037 [Actinomycetota bacterium]|jgi:hypothetical protein